MVGQSLSLALNQVRWLAALLVVVSHIRPLMFVEYGKSDVHHAGWALFYALTGLGRESVVVFFVVSGFLVGGLAMDRYRATGRFSLTDYMVARVSRIHTVLVPALVLGLVLDLLGNRLWADGGLYGQATAAYGITSIPDQVMQQADLPTFLINLFMLHGFVGTTLGSNGPLWSLAYEWWYYILMGLALAAASKRGAARWFAVCGMLAAGAAMPLDMWWAMPQWGVGVALAWALRSLSYRPAWWWAAGSWVAALGASRYLLARGGVDAWPAWGLTAKDMLIACTTGLFLWSCHGRRLTAVRLFGARLHARMADFSYSVYLTHFPMMVFAVSAWTALVQPAIRMQPSVISLACFVAVCLLCLIWGYLCSRVFERHTPSVRRFLQSALSVRRPTAPPVAEPVRMANMESMEPQRRRA